MVKRLQLCGMFAAALLSATGTHAQLVSEAPRADFVCTDGPVEHALEYDGTLYVAGNFANVGTLVGAVVSLDPQSAAADPAFPKLNGEIRAVAPDGEGGLYVSGDFDSNADGVREHLIRVLADGSIGAWAPDTGNVTAMVRAGNYVYLVGSFPKVENKSRTGLARVDADTGKLDLFWLPYTEGFPTRVLTAGNMLIIGGTFTKADGQVRCGLAAYDLTTGALLPWDPIPHGEARSINDMAVSGDTLYLLGYFELPGQPLDRRVSAIRISDGTPTGWGRNFYGGFFSAIAVGSEAVYLGGDYVIIGNQERFGGAALAVSNAAVLPWDPHVAQLGGSVGDVADIAVQGETVYLSGRFLTVGGQPRYCAAAVDLITAAPTSWDPGLAGGQENEVAFAEPGRIIMGGETYLAGAQPRTSVAAIDAESGQLTPWNPMIVAWGQYKLPGTVHDLVRRGGWIYIVGSGWETVNGQSNGGLVAVDADTGQTMSGFKPGFDFDPYDNEVKAVFIAADTLYVFGQRPLGQNQVERGLFALDAQTGERLAFTPMDGLVSSLAVAPDARFAYTNAQGKFDEFSLLTGQQTGWDTQCNSPPSQALVSGSTIYVAGSFSKVGNQARNGLAAFAQLDDRSRTLLPWDPAPNQGSVKIVGEAGVIYASGSFSHIGNADRKKLAALDPVSGLAMEWAPEVGSVGCTVIAVGPSGLVTGGGAFHVGGVYRQGFAVFPRER